MTAPNILMILVDEMRADALGCFGNKLGATPSLDRLAEGGVHFSQCMVPQPTCTPCRASLLTGCYPSALRSRMVGCRTPDDPRFLPRILGDAGYRTASVGKIHLVPQVEEPRAVEAARAGKGRCDYYGFQHVELVNGHGDRCFGPEYTAWLRQRVPDFAERRDKREALCSVPGCYRWPLPPEVHSSRYIADRASAYLRDAAGHDAPFFLHCSFPDPHHPFTVPEPYDTLFAPEDMEEPSMPITESTNPPHAGVECYRNTDASGDRIIGTPPCDYERFTAQDWKIVRAVTAGMNKQLDDCIGGLLAVLDQTGLAGNTIVVFASDHGDYLGDYGLLGKGLHYDCVLRTPLLMSGPGIPVSHRVDAMASLVDVVPTLLECAGLKEPEGMHGHSMLPGMTDESKWLRDAAMTENDDDMAGLRMRTLTTREWKLTTYAGDAFGELYNRLEDPGERDNLWNDTSCSDVQQQLTARLLDHMLCAVDGSNGRVQKPVPGVVKHRPIMLGEVPM